MNNELFDLNINFNPPQFELPLALQGLYENIRYTISQAMSWTWDIGKWIYDAINRALKPLRDFISSSISWISNKIWEGVSWLSNVFRNFINFIITELVKRVNWLYNTISGVGKWILNNIVSGLNSLRKWFEHFSRYISNEFWKGVSNLSTNIRNSVAWLWRAIEVNLIDPLIDFLKPVLDWLNKLFENLSKWFEQSIIWLKERLFDFSKWFMGLLSTAMNIFKGAIEWIVRSLYDTISSVITPKTPPRELETAINVMYSELFSRLTTMLEEMYTSPVVVEAAPSIALRAAMLVGTTTTVAEATGTAADQAHPLKNIGIRNIVESISRMLGVYTLTATPLIVLMETGVFRPLRYYYNAYFKPYIPREEDLVKMTIRGLLPESQFFKYMTWQGYDAEWSNRFLISSYWIPSFEELCKFVYFERITEDDVISIMRLKGVMPRYAQFYRDLVYRIPSLEDLVRFVYFGRISENQLIDYMRKVGFEPTIASYYRDLIWRIPPISDLIRFVVREVITPNQFYDLSEKMGLKEEYSRWYWDAHWVLPAFTLIRDAFWRGIIDEEEFKKYIVWHDYQPEARAGIRLSDQEIMLRLSWDLPTKIDIRWMYRWGIIDREEMLELAKAQGVDPQWRERVVDAWIKNEYLAEIERIIRDLKSDLRDGIISTAEFTDALRRLDIRMEAIEYHIQDALADAKRWKLRQIWKSLTRALEREKIDELAFVDLATKYGFETWKINDYLDILRLRKALEGRSS